LWLNLEKNTGKTTWENGSGEVVRRERSSLSEAMIKKNYLKKVVRFFKKI